MDPIKKETDPFKDEPKGDPAKKEEDLAKKLSQLTENTVASNTLAKIVADPQVRELLAARERGEDVEIKPKEAEKTQRETITFNKDLDELSNNELSKLLLEKVLAGVEGIVDQRVGSLETNVKDISQYLTKAQGDLAKRQVEEAASKISDFEDHRDAMAKISKDNPGLGLEELYVIAKMKSGHDFFKKGNPESERPSHINVRPTQKTSRKEPLPRGRSGFKQAMQEALEKVDVGF